MNFYNENDKKTAAWLRELIKCGHIPNGIVDERSIEDIKGNELSEFIQCHFFAGIGGWSYALRLAAWPEKKHIWTGSCPCQPFSNSGKNEGLLDKRHLWPAFQRLIQERKPSTVIGEQVASKAGRDWLSGVRFEMEGMGYEFGAANLCSAGVGAHDIRQRLYWVADSDGNRLRCERSGPIAKGAWSKQQFEGLVQVALQFSLPAGRIGGISDGFPARMVALRGFGNAINPILAAEFIKAYCEC
jgi:DNA (cytosine-5)-methyltransferase 1